MKLAEALQERADLNVRIKQLNARIESNVLVQEGEEPSEDPNRMLAELRSCVERLEFLMKKINLSNCTHKVDGVTLTELIARKDALKELVSAYRNAIAESSMTYHRARGSEIKIVSAIDAKALRKEEDAMSKELRLVDNKLQKANWDFDLIED